MRYKIVGPYCLNKATEIGRLRDNALTSERTMTYMWLPGERLGTSEAFSKRNWTAGPAEKT